MLPHLSRCCQISFVRKFWKSFFQLRMWLTSVASTSVYKSCQSSWVSTILIIHPTYYLLPVIDVYVASHSCKATIDQLKLISIIVILKCNRCGIYYEYSKYRNPSSRWNLYDSPRIAIEGSDVRFVQHRVTEMASLLGVCFSRLTVTDYFSIYAFQSLLVILLCDSFSCFKM